MIMGSRKNSLTGSTFFPRSPLTRRYVSAGNRHHSLKGVTSTTPTMASTSSPPPPPGNGKPAGRAKGGRPFSKSSKPNTVSLSHLTVDSPMIASNSIGDLNARHRSSN
jgi:hypothetical protein